MDLRGGKKEGEKRKERRRTKEGLEGRKKGTEGRKKTKKNKKNQNVHVFKNCVSFSRCGLRIKRVLCSLA